MAQTAAEAAPTRAATLVPLIIGLCFAVALLEGYDLQAMGVAAPRLVPALDLTARQVGDVLTASMLGLIVGALIGGRVADRVGRKPVLLGAVVAFGIFSLATVLTRDYPQLLAARAATGLGLGGALPNLIAIAADIAGEKRRAATGGLIFGGMSLGGAASALLVLLAPKSLDWRPVFMVGGALPLVIFPLLAFGLPETRPGHAAADRPAPAPYARILFGEGRAAATLALWAAFVLTLVVLYLLVNWLPLLVVAKGLSRAAAPMAAIALNLSGTIGALALGALVDRFGLRWPMLASYAALVASMAALAAASGLAPILVWSGAAGFLVIGTQFVLYGAAPDYYRADARGAGAGAAVGVGRLGSVIGPSLAGVMISHGASAGQVMLAMIPVVAAAGAAVLTLTIVGQRAGG
jgi:AAHS family 3-hydroxyphenylpropionic acid transporter